jgi:hypothetical protein
MNKKGEEKGFMNNIYNFFEKHFHIQLRDNHLEKELYQSFQQIVNANGYVKYSLNKFLGMN